MEENGIRIKIGVRLILEAELAERNYNDSIAKRNEYLNQLEPKEINLVNELLIKEKEERERKKIPGT